MSKKSSHSSQWSSRATLRQLEGVLSAKLPPKSHQKVPILKSWKSLSIVWTSQQGCHRLPRTNQPISLTWRSIQASSRRAMLFLNHMEPLEMELGLGMVQLRSIRRSIWDQTRRILLTRRVRTLKTLPHLRRWRSQRVMLTICKPQPIALDKIFHRLTSKD